MFTFLQLLPWRRLVFEQLPACGSAWLIAEMFYKWKSFSLEMVGFLVTWFLIDGVIQGLRWLMVSRRSERG